MQKSTEEFDVNYEIEWPGCDDGPITIDDPIVCYKRFDQVSWYRLQQMIKRWPAMRKSWEAFIIDYNVCLATITEEEKHADDDIPF